METNLTDQELINEVRDALAGLDSVKIPDDTIIQANERFVEPLLNETIPSPSPDQKLFDNAAIAWTAEKAFDAWMTFSRLRDREVETFVDPKGYRENLRERTETTLYVLNATRPPKSPNTVVTVKHDGEQRRVDLSKSWVPDR